MITTISSSLFSKQEQKKKKQILFNKFNIKM